jgi:polyhydroxyalkanoate synthesis regulator phasin
MVDKLGSFTANFVAELGKKLIEKGVFTQDEMQKILADAINETAKQQQEKEKVCNSNYTSIN